MSLLLIRLLALPGTEDKVVHSMGFRNNILRLYKKISRGENLFLQDVIKLLSKLESLDPSLVRNRRKSIDDQARRRLRDRITERGPAALRTVLKYSRHEGWNYREDVRAIIGAFTDDPIGLFIQGLSDTDEEIRWSCAKWLRDEAKGEIRAIQPLLEYARRNQMLDNSVLEALETIGQESGPYLLDLILDEDAALSMRLSAAGYPFSSISEEQAANLETLLSSPTLDPDLRDSVKDLLGGHKRC